MVKAQPGNKCLGTKRIDPQTHEPYYDWKSYEQVHQEVLALASFIDQFDLAAPVTDNEFNMSLKTVGLCSINREEWLITDLACNLLGITSVPLYDTLGDEMLQLILNQTEMTTLFGSSAGLLKLANLLVDSFGLDKGKTLPLDFKLKNFVCWDTPDDSAHS